MMTMFTTILPKMILSFKFAQNKFNAQKRFIKVLKGRVFTQHFKMKIYLNES